MYSARLTADSRPQISPLRESTITPGLPWVASRKVPPTASTMATLSLRSGSLRRLRHTSIMISTGPRYCSTVAVPALEQAMDVR